MRGMVQALVGALLLSSILAGCLSQEDDAPDEPAEPRSPTSEAAHRSFSRAQDAARDAAGGGELVAAFGVTTSNAGALGVAGDFPGFAELVPKATVSGLVPGTGDLQNWAFIYQDSPEAESLSAVVVNQQEDGEMTVDASTTVERRELVLLRAGRPIDGMPGTSPTDALEAAIAQEAWGSIAHTSSAFVLFILTADDSGSPEWQMITYRRDSGNGKIVRIGGSSGSVEGGVQDWPDRPTRGTKASGGDDTNTKIPGDEEAFTVNVDGDQYPGLYLTPDRTGTGELIGDPVVEVISPGGSATTVQLNETHREADPEGGEWQVRFTWELPDLYRVIRVTYCIQPEPYLFGEQTDACE